MTSIRHFTVIQRQERLVDGPCPLPGLPSCQRIALEQWGCGFHFRTESHTPLVLVVVTGGTLRQTNADGSYVDLTPGSVGWCGPNGLRDHAAPLAGGCQVWSVSMDMRSYGQREDALLGQRPGHCRPAQMARILADVQSLWDSIDVAGPQVNALAGLGCATLLHRLAEERQRPESLGEAQATWLACRQRLWRDAASLTSAGQLADACGISQAHLTRLFRRFSGETPARALLRLRCQLAQELLADRRRSVASVAEELGFSDPYVFSRAFKRCLGYSPGSSRGG